jgi:hypothetical protein
MVGIFILELAATGEPVNEWLVVFDPNGNDGRGTMTTSPDPVHATRFADATTALACWKQPSTVVPYRADGKPNRPLTAYTVDVRPVVDR